ncbi:type IV pilin protein [Pokkaliibacter sp. CJK22405]|uniref:type IV pilin protein n=1 Tax=Pokkaliibacter sp. CJK22405 TaxID=3384615 RepID=UPI0039850C97
MVGVKAVRSPSSMQRVRGFTLIEMMITVAIIGILAAFAYPSYTRYVERSNRVDAQGVMMQASMALQRHYGNAFTYVGADVSNFDQSPLQGNAKYLITYTLSAATPHEFLITATPQGIQTKDACGTLTIDENGEKTVSKSTVDDCW